MYPVEILNLCRGYVNGTQVLLDGNAKHNNANEHLVAGQYNQSDLWAMQAVRMHGVYSGGVAKQHVSRATMSLLCLHLHRMHSGTALSVGLCAFLATLITLLYPTTSLISDLCCICSNYKMNCTNSSKGFSSTSLVVLHLVTHESAVSKRVLDTSSSVIEQHLPQQPF